MHCATSLSPTALSSVCCCTLLFWTSLSVQTVKCAVAYFFGLLCTRAIKYLRQKYVFWDAPIHCVETGTAAQQHCKAVCLSNTSPDLFSFIRAATSGSRRVSETQDSEKNEDTPVLLSAAANASAWTASGKLPQRAWCQQSHLRI